jgi:hypothetical protein
MTSVVMFSNINEPLLLKLKEQFETIDLEWLIKQGSAVSDTQRNIVRAEQNDQNAVHLMVFPQDYHTQAGSTDPRWIAWTREVGVKPPTASYAHGGVSLHVY